MQEVCTSATGTAPGNWQPRQPGQPGQPSAYGTAPTSSLPLSKGGLGLVLVPTQVQALQAKVVSRFLACRACDAGLEGVSVVPPEPSLSGPAYGFAASILFKALDTGQLQLSARLSAYVAAFGTLHPHRLDSVTAIGRRDKPLFLNMQIRQPADSSATTNSACNSDSLAKAPQAFSGHH